MAHARPEETRKSSRWERAEALVPPAADDPLPSDRVAMGSLIKPWGIRGDQTLRLHNPDSELLLHHREVVLEGPGFAPRRATIDRARWVGRRFVVRLVGIATPEQAEALRGLELSVAAEALPELEDDDENYVRDLLGLRVVDEHGVEMGELADVFATGGNDVYVVRGPEGETLIPAVRDYVTEVDLDRGLVRVRRLEL